VLIHAESDALLHRNEPDLFYGSPSGAVGAKCIHFPDQELGYCYQKGGGVYVRLFCDDLMVFGGTLPLPPLSGYLMLPCMWSKTSMRAMSISMIVG